MGLRANLNLYGFVRAGQSHTADGAILNNHGGGVGAEGTLGNATLDVNGIIGTSVSTNAKFTYKFPVSKNGAIQAYAYTGLIKEIK